ncbi:MAG: alkaline phosphatase family protein, partial [Cyanobacteria bacterium J06642_2]
SYGRLESSIPAITVPAWSCMMSGRDPGELGIYGFRNRRDRGYQNMTIADGRAVKVPRLWDFLGDAGWSVAALSVPGTSPPYPINGTMVSCFLTPNLDVPYTYPPELADDIAAWLPEFVLDVPEFRSEDKQRILQDIYALCDQRFTLASKLIARDAPDFLMLVDMGVDRIHHSFWKPMDLRHPHHEPGSPFATAIHDYYCHVDRCVGELLGQCSEDTAVLIVSDHGAQPLMGGFCLNEWLRREGYLVLKSTPTQPTPLEEAEVDWSQTRVWGAGGYYGRIFLNVQGREPQGVIPIAEFEAERSRLIEKLEMLCDPSGRPLPTKVYKPQEIYKRVRGMAPDAIAYFDDLAWRSVGLVGSDLFVTSNDTGPDDANHAPHGLMIFHDPNQPRHGQKLHDAQLYDIIPTLLTRYDLPTPSRLRGKVLPI